jgi:hypothetical protein
MSVRRDKDRLRLVSSPQTKSEGRASRAERASIPHRPTLPGEEGAIASLVLAFADPLHASADPSERKRAAYAVGHARKRVRAAVGPEHAPEVFARAQVTRRDLAAVQAAHEAARERLIAGAVEAVSTMQEHEVECSSARASVAVAKRLYALGSALLDVGARDLDPDKLKAGAGLIAAGRLELLNALELDRRAKVARGGPGSRAQQRIIDAGLARIAADREERARLAALEGTAGDPEAESETRVSDLAPAEPDGVCTACGGPWPMGLDRCPTCGEADDAAS